LKFDGQTIMGRENWDAALVMRANELLTEIRRYHVDAEATRLQLASAAASISRKVDELPSTVRQVVEESLHQDSLIAERHLLTQRLEHSSRLLNELSSKFNNSGLSFLATSRRLFVMLILSSVAIGMAATVWAMISGAKVIKLSTEISELQEAFVQLGNSGSQPPIKTCVDSFSRLRLCVRIDDVTGKSKDSYYFVSR
jgi:outer membrane murein-binding lipoprotein Lpp